MADSTELIAGNPCRECGKPVMRKPGRRGPERCIVCAAARDQGIRTARERVRVRASRAKPEPAPRKCLDCSALVYRSKSKWPERCKQCTHDHTNRIRNARHAAKTAATLAAIHESPCEGCGGQVLKTARRPKLLLCEECRRIRRNARSVQLRNASEARAQARRATERAWRDRNPWVAAQSTARRRILLEQAVSEPFTFQEIYERDQWICQICMQPVDRSIKWPNLLAATLDHIVPVSKGGPHVRDNVRLAHYFCNCSKGDRTAATSPPPTYGERA